MAAYLHMRFVPVQAAAVMAGPLFDRMKSFLTGGDINPFIGAVGISAFPMAG
ncbi:MAG: glutaconyl-CoA decarboxylase subunit beta, partial [Chloroflexi bacterium CFX2]|nr:glutaconyl-CoA decarboxylase subunit beta [Chloroflexi bacterium CFX2]